MPNYQNLTEKELKFGYWFVGHQILLKRILIAFLIFLCLDLYSYTIYQLTNDILNTGQREKMLNQMTVDLVNFEAYRATHKPKDLEIGAISVFPLGGNRYDLVAKISNPNDKWAAKSFSYQFLVDGAPTEVKTGYLFPSEEKYIFNLGYKSNASISNATIKLEGINWQRYFDFATFYGEHFNFDVTDVKFYPLGSPELGENVRVSKASFTVTNKSAYNFWSIGFEVLLWRGGQVAAVNYITLDQVLSGQKRQADVFWFEPLSGITQVQVIPEVNILDKSVYMPI